MLATLYSFLFKTEDYDSRSGTLIGLVILLIGILITFTLYSIALVDETTDKNPKKKQESLRSIIIYGFSLSVAISVFVGFSINRYNFCKANPDICVLDYSFSPFA
jgi:dolichyl-phosphate-mannose--protein O-mannosyl transferase